MKQKTAIRQLIEQIDEELKSAVLVPYRNALHNTKALALKLEPVNEQQIIDAFNQGFREGENCGELNNNSKDVSEYEDAEIFFNKTFEKP